MVRRLNQSEYSREVRKGIKLAYQGKKGLEDCVKSVEGYVSRQKDCINNLMGETENKYSETINLPLNTVTFTMQQRAAEHKGLTNPNPITIIPFKVFRFRVDEFAKFDGKL